MLSAIIVVATLIVLTTAQSNTYQYTTCSWEWSDWSPCLGECDNGEKIRTTVCTCGGDPDVDENRCAKLKRPKDQSAKCSLDPCCTLSEWNSWSDCTRLCDTGYQHRDKNCTCKKDAKGNPLGKCGDGYGKSGIPTQERKCNTIPCCTYQGFEEWSTCSRSCDAGIRTRAQKCVCIPNSNPKKGCANDDYSAAKIEREECNTQSCCYYSGFGEWTPCSAQCDGGFRKRTEVCKCSFPNATISDCYQRLHKKPLEEKEGCNEQPCCTWDSWLEWSKCSKPCDNGTQFREASCSCQGKTATPKDCFRSIPNVPRPKEFQSCNTQPCCIYSGFEEWTSCSAQCDGGFQKRTEICQCIFNDTVVADCVKFTGRIPVTNYRTCNTEPCCTYVGFEEWGPCSLPCGGGTRVRRGACQCIFNNTSPQDCISLIPTPRPVESEACNTESCCIFSGFEEWTPCSAQCGGGYRVRTEQCVCINNNTAIDCSQITGRLPVSEYHLCNTEPCCTYVGYEEWTPCSKQCGGGIRTRSAGCQCIFKDSTAQDCRSLIPTPTPTETEQCNTHSCCTYTGFDEWSACNKICGGGIKLRTQTCMCVFNGSKESDCLEFIGRPPVVENQTCNTEPCCEWDGWLEWSKCSTNCGGGMRRRLSNCSCVFPRYKILDCLKIITEPRPAETETCNTRPCCRWGEWQDWSECDVTCGIGNRTRVKACECIGKKTLKECLEIMNEPRPKEITSCDKGTCCHWTKWSHWGACSAKCGDGTKLRNRKCECKNPNPKSYDTYSRISYGECPGDSQESQTCNNGYCYSY